jgi:hypothetical protein
MSEEHTGPHKDFAALLKCSGTGTIKQRQGGKLVDVAKHFHDPWLNNAAWETYKGVEVSVVYSTEIDASLPEAVAGYALRYKVVTVRAAKVSGANPTKGEKTRTATKIFATRQKAVAYAAAKNEAAEDRYQALKAGPEADGADEKYLGTIEQRTRTNLAYRKAALAGGGFARWHAERAKLPGEGAWLPALCDLANALKVSLDALVASQ